MSFSHLCNGLGQITINLLLMIPIHFLYSKAYTLYGIIDIDTSNPLSWIIALFISDLCYYIGHRAGHRVNLIIGIHYVHHQASDYNLLSAFRLPWFNRITMFWFFLPLAFIGFPFELVMFSMAINSLVATLCHTGVTKRELGWVESLFVTPRSHYVHHGINPLYRDKNYGGVFIIWDKLFGTFQALDEDVPVLFPEMSLEVMNNPIEANVNYFKKIHYVMKKRETLFSKICVLFQKPESITDELYSYPSKKNQRVINIKVPNHIKLMITIVIIVNLHFLSILEEPYSSEGLIFVCIIFILLRLLGSLLSREAYLNKDQIK